MSNEAITIIKNIPIEIAESQSMTNKTNQDTTDTPTITAYKYIQQQYNDELSKLHSDIIDYLGTFFTKQESIQFGYLNKQLYIETQKQSYLLKRSNDDTVFLRYRQLHKLLLTRSDGFNYTFPKALEIEIDHKLQLQSNMSTKLWFFGNFFRRVNNLECNNLLALSHLPVELLFNINSNFYSDDKSRANIESICISGYLSGSKFFREKKHW